MCVPVHPLSVRLYAFLSQIRNACFHVLRVLSHAVIWQGLQGVAQVLDRFQLSKHLLQKNLRIQRNTGACSILSCLSEVEICHHFERLALWVSLRLCHGSRLATILCIDVCTYVYKHKHPPTYPPNPPTHICTSALSLLTANSGSRLATTPFAPLP